MILLFHPCKRLFLLNDGDWSSLLVDERGNRCFYQKQKEGITEPDETQIAHVDQLLSWKAQQTWLQSLLPELEERKALAIDYLLPKREPEADV